MHRLLRKVLAASFAAVFLGAGTVSAEIPPILPVGEVAQGMSGTAYTVVDESGEIRPFHVDVVGVIQNGKTTTPMIMAKASGDLIESTGGVLQGMSGSPVYLDGRLVGALSSSVKDLSPFTFFITPIEDMIALWNMPDNKNQTHISTIDLKKVAEERAAREKKDDEKKETEEAKAPASKDASAGTDEKAAQQDAEAKPAEAKPAEAEPVAKESTEEKSGVYLQGFNDASRSFLLNHTFLGRSSHIRPLDATFFTGEKGTDYHATLQPGSMMGVALAYGDFSIAATGTVTLVDGKRVLGFGHSFLHKGNVNYFLTDASVVGTVSGVSAGMKLSNIGHIIGRISQDRDTGVAGELGVFPNIVPMKVLVRDHVLGREQSYTTRIAYDEDLLAQLTASMAYAAMSKTSDTMGENTIQIHFVIRTDAAESGKAERTNMFYNVSDVGKTAILELAQAVNIICSNPDEESSILDVQAEIDVNGGRKTATLVSAVPDKTKVKPGEIVNFTTTLKPYRNEKITLTIPYQVPKKQLPGILNLDVRGGGLVPAGQGISLQQGADGSLLLSLPMGEDRNISTKEKLKQFLSTHRNNEIVIAPGAAPVMNEKQQKKAAKEALEAAKHSSGNQEPRTVKLLGSDKPKDNGEAKLVTDYIIENSIHAVLHVEK